MRNTAKQPSVIFVTHGHGDHFFGAGPVLDAFPGAQLVACDQQVGGEARGQTTAKVMASWNSRFAGQLSQSPVVPALTNSQELDLEGHPLLFRTIGGADGALASLLGQIDGPVLLAVHSYGGAVISNAATSAPNVVGLVFVAAFAPEESETLGEVENGSKDSVLGTALVQYQYPPGPGGQTAVEFAINPAIVREAFAADLPEQQTALLAATQRPAAAAAFPDASGPPAWKTLPSWAVVATGDKAAGTDVIRSQAQRAGATSSRSKART